MSAHDVEQSGVAKTGSDFLDTLTGGLNTFLNFKLTKQQLSADQREQTGADFAVANAPPAEPFTLAGLAPWQAGLLVLGVGLAGFGIAKAFGK